MSLLDAEWSQEMQAYEMARVESDAPGDFVRLMRLDVAQPSSLCLEESTKPPRMNLDLKFNRADSQSLGTRECSLEGKLRVLVRDENEKIFHVPSSISRMQTKRPNQALLFSSHGEPGAGRPR